MNINPVNDLAASTQAMGELLKQMTDARQGMDDKMLRVQAAEAEQAAGTGGIDVTA